MDQLNGCNVFMAPLNARSVCIGPNLVGAWPLRKGALKGPLSQAIATAVGDGLKWRLFFISSKVINGLGINSRPLRLELSYK